MLNNLDLFYECLQHRVPNIDKITRDVLNRIVIPVEDDAYSELLLKNYELIELIEKYNNLNINGNLSQNDEIINSIDDCLHFEGMNLCPFSQYLMIHDLTYDIYLNELSIEEKKYIVESYLEHRHQMYMNHEYSDIIFQVMTDNYVIKEKR